LRHAQEGYGRLRIAGRHKENRCSCVQGLEIAERDPLARALAVSLGIKEQDGVALFSQELSAAEHASTIGTHCVRQYDGAESGAPRRIPGTDAATRSAQKGNWRATRERSRRRPDLARHRCGKRAAERPHGCCSTADREYQNQRDPDSPHLGLVALPSGPGALLRRTLRRRSLGHPMLIPKGYQTSIETRFATSTPAPCLAARRNSKQISLGHSRCCSIYACGSPMGVAAHLRRIRNDASTAL